MNRYECSLNIRQGFPLFSALIEANSIKQLLLAEVMNIDEMEESEFLKTAKTPHLDEMIYNSIAPAIYGHYNVKRALTLAMFGGV